MISLRPPSPERIAEILRDLTRAEFSYPEVGATRAELPDGYNIDRHSAVIGHGDACFESAMASILASAPFDLPWVENFPESEPRVGAMTAVVARVFGAWWINVSRVVYLIDEPDAFGFAYGTLPVHAESGEELFLVERSSKSDEVHYRLLAFSRPRHPLARLGAPFSRGAQHRFAVGSIEAMRRAASS